jgi:predicted aldo/keto reductase-like oxidoreductase
LRQRFSRRDFLGTTVVGAAAAGTLSAADALADPMPTRILGKTGARVTIIGMGCGSRWLSYGNEDTAIQALNLAIDSGIGYLDTAYGYNRGQSETWVGKVMKTRRKDVFLATKIEPRNGDEAMKVLDSVLTRLQTSQIDLISIHSLSNENDLAQIEAKDGILNALYKLRDQKVTRFVGITSHTDPMVMKTALERHDFDCVQMALNAALQGMRSTGGGNQTLNPAVKTSFELVALPVAVKKNLGIIGMKVMAQDALLEPGPKQKDPAKLFRYTLSLPIATAIIGMPKVEHIQENAKWARAFTPLSDTEMKEYSHQTAEQYKAAIDLKFDGHVDA